MLAWKGGLSIHIVVIKETFDSRARIALNDNGAIDSRNVMHVINPYDEYAIEEAINVKEKYGGTVMVVTASVSIQDP